jgi:hypothetical protein
MAKKKIIKALNKLEISSEELNLIFKEYFRDIYYVYINGEDGPGGLYNKLGIVHLANIIKKNISTDADLKAPKGMFKEQITTFSEAKKFIYWFGDDPEITTIIKVDLFELLKSHIFGDFSQS